MSNQFAIASVTRTIQALLEKADITVTTKTPDLAARDAGKRLNLFLYHTMHNAAWRNQDIPGRVRPGERGNPPLALNLFYLLTAYGEEGTDLADQQLLGTAMRVLHDRPILKSEYIRTAVGSDRDLRNSDLADQIEKVRIVPEYLDIENMSRLWTTFQTQYRVSAAYQASVVLIESLRPTSSALPVAQRGQDDRGASTDIGMDAALESVEYRSDPQEPKLPAASIGSLITINGVNLPTTDVSVVVYDPKATVANGNGNDEVAVLQPEPGGSNLQLRVHLAEQAGIWRAGLLALETRFTKDGRQRSSNSVPLAVAPQLLTSDAGNSIVAFVDDRGNKRLLTVSLVHPLGENRKVLLTLNRFSPQQDESQQSNQFFQISAEKDELGVGSLNPSFDVSAVPSGEYWVRIRVDGIDSMVMHKTTDPETERIRVQFDPKQKIKL